MNTAVTRNDWVGRVIDGRFPLLEWLGKTEEAGVFRTELIGPQPRRAVIRLVAAQPECAETLLRNWQQAATLSHPHLMRIFSSGRAQVGGVGLLYVVTEYADESLAQVIPERPLTAGEAREMLVPIFDALSYLHDQGLVHGHIKPSNIMVVGDRVKLPVESVRRAGTNGGPREQSKIYHAPELAAGTALPASDVWSLGITLVQALTQHLPAWDRSAGRDPVVTSEIREPFAGIARACLRYDAGKRASLRDLKVLLNQSPTLEEPANEFDQLTPAEADEDGRAGDDEPRSNPRISAKVRMGAMVAALVVVLAVIAFVLTRSNSSHSVTSVTPPPAAKASHPQPDSPQHPVPPRNSGIVKGEVESRVMPDVSASANRTIHGKVEERIRVNVDPDGTVASARIESRSHSRYYGSKAVDAARKWRFKPARQDGKPVPSVWLLHFKFRRSGPDVNAVETSP